MFSINLVKPNKVWPSHVATLFMGWREYPRKQQIELRSTSSISPVLVAINQFDWADTVHLNRPSPMQRRQMQHNSTSIHVLDSSAINSHVHLLNTYGWARILILITHQVHLPVTNATTPLVRHGAPALQYARWWQEPQPQRRDRSATTEKYYWLICYERKILFRLKKQAEKNGL